MIETFMQNAQLLIDNHYELQTIMLSILSKLCIIRVHGFGERCFNTLQELMVAGKDMEEQVIRSLNKEVILKLKKQSLDLVPDSLLKGLQRLVEKSEKATILEDLYENCFPTWLRSLKQTVANRRGGALIEHQEQYDAIVALMAVSLKDCPENVEKAYERRLVPLIAEITNESNWEQERYIHCLRIIYYISIKNAKAADEFINKQILQNLM